MATLGIQLTTSTESEDAHTVIQLTRAALAKGHTVRLFVMCDGIYNLQNESFQALAREGASISVCGHNAAQRHIEPIEDVPNLEWGSQHDFAKITAECDRVVVFN